MSCVVVATSPALAASHSPSLRQRDESNLLAADARPPSAGSSLDILPSSPLVSTTPKLSPMISVYKPSSPITLPSPRVQCSPKTPSWTSPMSTPTTRSSCLCGGFSICSSCSCTLASASPGELRWRSFPEKRDSHADVKSNASTMSPLEAPSPRMNSLSRILNSTPRLQTLVEVPSPNFGGCNNLSHFTSPKFLPRTGHVKFHPSVVADDSGNKENAGVETLEPWIFGPEEFLRLDVPKDQDELSESLQFNVGGAASAEKDIAGHSGRPSTPPLKRKRPPKLEIPQSASLVPNMMPHGVDLNEDAINEMTFEGPYFGISCKKGRREQLEDTHRAIPDFNGDPSQAFFGVFDGHGGRKAADFAAENLVHNIMDAMDRSEISEGYMEAAVRAGYLTTDADFLQKGVSSGASCVTAVMRDGYMVVANAGDCRAVLSRDGQAEALTRDHRAGREDERKRIEKLGGYVDNLTGTWRVQGVLAVSRGIGDLHLKEWISAEPEVQKLRITSDCEFLILASDGLWDAMSNQEAVDFARVVLQLPRPNGELASASLDLTSSIAKVVGTKPAQQDALEHNPRVSEADSRNKSSERPTKTDGSEEGKKMISSSAEDDLDISAGAIDSGVPDTGIPETPAPAMGPVAACKRLLEIALQRGCHDDISVIVVDLQHFAKLSHSAVQSIS